MTFSLPLPSSFRKLPSDNDGGDDIVSDDDGDDENDDDDVILANVNFASYSSFGIVLKSPSMDR